MKAWGQLLTIVVALSGARAAGAEVPPPTAAEVLTALPGVRVEEVMTGATVLRQARESDSREMSVALVCLLPPEAAPSLTPFHNGRALLPEQYEGESGEIDLGEIEGSLAAVRLESKAEARRYLDAKPGWDLSLSAREIAAFQALEPRPGSEVEAVEDQLRKVLAGRLRDYRSKGLPGIAPYDRGSGETSSPGEDLRRSTLASVGIERVAPRIHAALPRFPVEPPPGGSEWYFWTRLSVLGRPVFLLHHRIATKLGDRAVVIERQFHATHFLGGGQTITALVPVQEGTLAAYINKTFVDRWSGPRIGTKAKRAVGLKILNGYSTTS